MAIWVSKESSGPKDYSYPPYKPKKDYLMVQKRILLISIFFLCIFENFLCIFESENRKPKPQRMLL